MKIEKGKGEWATASMPGTIYENQAKIMDILDKGKANAESAKVLEGNGPDDKRYSFVFMKNLSP